MKNNELIAKLQKFNGDLPVEMMAECPDVICGALFSSEISIVVASDRLQDENADLEDCLVLSSISPDGSKEQFNGEVALIALLRVRECLWDYYRALDRREHGGVAANTFVEKIESVFGASFYQGISSDLENKDVNYS